MARTYGTYRLVGEDRGRVWMLDLEPAVRMRARAVFPRTQQTRTTVLSLAYTEDICRDLEWFMRRYPLKPADAASKAALTFGATAQREREAQIAKALKGDGPDLVRDYGDRTPAKEPREYQLQALRVLRAGGRLLLGDEVGLGKTFNGLLAAIHEDALPMLVVPPTHLPPRWETELQEAFPWLTFETAKKTKPTAAVAAGVLPDVLIVSYSKLDGWAPYLAGKIATVVFDEVQELRTGRHTNKGAAAAIVTGASAFALGLSATPIHNYGSEVWNLYDILAPGMLGTREEFGREWCVGDMVTDPAALGAHLREQGLLLARTRAMVGRELPPAVKVPHMVDSDYSALAEVEKSVEALARTILADTSTASERFQAAGEIDWRLRHATGKDKAPYVADFVRMLLQSEQRVVLWGWHRDVYDIWVERLKEFHPLLYTGSESPKQKRAAEVAFTTPISEANPLDSACRVLIMSLRSGAGVDGLQKVPNVGVFGELDWSPAVHEQAIGRLRRDDLIAPPVAYFLTSAHGSDPKILEVLDVKRQQSEPILSPDGKLFANASQDVNRGRELARQILGIQGGEAA